MVLGCNLIMNDEDKRLLSNFANRAMGGIGKPKEKKTSSKKVEIDALEKTDSSCVVKQEEKQYYEPEHKQAEDVFDKLFNKDSYQYKNDIFDKLNVVRKAFFYIFNSAINIFNKTVRQSTSNSAIIYVPRKYIGCPVTVVIWPKDSGLTDGIAGKNVDPEKVKRAEEKYLKYKATCEANRKKRENSFLKKAKEKENNL